MLLPSYHKDTPPHTFRTTATGMACLSVHQSATVYRIMATTRLVIIKPSRTSRWGPCDPVQTAWRVVDMALLLLPRSHNSSPLYSVDEPVDTHLP